jgi:hypothetical protein
MLEIVLLLSISGLMSSLMTYFAVYVFQDLRQCLSSFSFSPGILFLYPINFSLSFKLHSILQHAYNSFHH